MTELPPPAAQAPNAALATEPIRNLGTLELETEIQQSPPERRTAPKIVKIAAALLCMVAIASIAVVPILFPALFVAGTVMVAGVAIIAGASGTIPLSTQIPGIYEFFVNRGTRRRG